MFGRGGVNMHEAKIYIKVHLKKEKITLSSVTQLGWGSLTPPPARVV